MKNAFVKACLEQEGTKNNPSFPVPFEYISATFDLDDDTRYQACGTYDDILKTAFGMGVFYGRRKETHVYLSEPAFRSKGASEHSDISGSAGILAMKYLTFTGRRGFCLAIKPKTFAMPEIISYPLAFGIHGFHDGDQTLYVDKLMLPAFDQCRRHQGMRSIAITSESLTYAQRYATLCMEQINASAPILMLENLRTAAPENLVQALTGTVVGPVTGAVLNNG